LIKGADGINGKDGIHGKPGADGKTEVSSIIRKLHVPVIDIDSIYTDILKPGTVVYNSLLQLCGEEILSDNGEIDFGKLSIKISAAPWLNLTLSDLMDEEIGNFIQKLKNDFASSDVEYAGFECGAIAVSKIRKFMNYVITVEAEKFARYRRLVNDFSFEIAKRMVDQDDFISLINQSYSIINNGTIHDLENNTINVISKMMNKTFK
jgi:dephospho-CoA kinase